MAPSTVAPSTVAPWHQAPWHRTPWHRGTVPWHRVPWHRTPWHRVPWHRTPWHRVPVAPCTRGTVSVYPWHRVRVPVEKSRMCVHGASLGLYLCLYHARGCTMLVPVVYTSSQHRNAAPPGAALLSLGLHPELEFNLTGYASGTLNPVVKYTN